MKTLAILPLFFVLFSTIGAQVTLEKTYDYSATVVKFETLGYKYYLMDVPSAQCRIYNTDHSLYKTINCFVPSGCYLYDIKFLSENLFDSDAGIELLYTWYRYNTDSAYYNYDSRIINEDGSELVYIQGALYNYINKTGDETYKLFSYCYDFSGFPEVIWTNIYSLPGKPVVNVALMGKGAEFLLNAYPNPVSNTLKVVYKLPENVDSGVLQLYDNSGRPINQFVVDHFSDHLDLDVSKLASGVYHYFIEYGDKKSPSKKLVVQ